MGAIKSIKTICLNLVLIFAGSLICAAAIKGILIPKQFLAGGLTGLALLIHYVLPILPVGVIYFLLTKLKEDPDWVWSLKAAMRPKADEKNTIEIRIFNPAAAAREGVVIANFNS